MSALCFSAPTDFPGHTTWPSLTPTGLEEIGLVVRENLFDRTHFVLESSCRVTPFERPLEFLDSQVTARWTQSILLQIEPARYSDFMVDAGFGYSLERSTVSAHFGECVAHSLAPSILIPMTISYSRPNRSGSAHSFLQFEWELNPYSFSRTTTLFHRLTAQSHQLSSSSLTLYGREKVLSYSPLDPDFTLKDYQVGFVFEHQSY